MREWNGLKKGVGSAGLPGTRARSWAQRAGVACPARGLGLCAAGAHRPSSIPPILPPQFYVLRQKVMEMGLAASGWAVRARPRALTAWATGWAVPTPCARPRTPCGWRPGMFPSWLSAGRAPRRCPPPPPSSPFPPLPQGTEPAGTGKLNKFYPKDGFFVCAGCGAKLYE